MFFGGFVYPHKGTDYIRLCCVCAFLVVAVVSLLLCVVFCLCTPLIVRIGDCSTFQGPYNTGRTAAVRSDGPTAVFPGAPFGHQYRMPLIESLPQVNVIFV